MSEKYKIILCEIFVFATISIGLYILGEDPKMVYIIGGFVVFLSVAFLDPPSRHREFTLDDVTHARDPFPSPGTSRPTLPQFKKRKRKD